MIGEEVYPIGTTFVLPRPRVKFRFRFIYDNERLSPFCLCARPDVIFHGELQQRFRGHFLCREIEELPPLLMPYTMEIRKVKREICNDISPGL